MKVPAESRQRDLRRGLADYNAKYPDNNFLDDMHAWGNESGLMFSSAQAEAIESALTSWQRRINGAVFDPDRCPYGYDADIWILAGEFRDVAEAHGLPCAGRKIVYGELSRVIRRDNLDHDYAPWQDKNGKPGWVRMLSKIIELFIYENAETKYPYGLCQELAQPGVIQSYSSSMVEQAKLDLLLQREKENKLRSASTPPAAPERKAAVRAYIAGRETQRSS